MTITEAGYTAPLGLENTAPPMVLTPSVTLVLSLCFSWTVLRSRVRGRHWSTMTGARVEPDRSAMRVLLLSKPVQLLRGGWPPSAAL
jgi:hypothetical protein